MKKNKKKCDKMSLKYFNNLAYEDIGEYNDEIILFLHPKLLSHWIWRKQIEEYDKYFNNYHCIFIDLPHHGESKFDGKFSIEESKDIIIEFINHLLSSKKSESINIVAIGLGASIALEMINKESHLINHLILSGLEIAPIREKEENTILKRLAKTKAEYLNMKPDQFIIKAYLRYYGINKDYYDDLEKSLDIPIRKEKEIAYESFNYTVPNFSKETIEKDNILLIYGTKDNFNSTKSAIELKELFKNAKLIEIEKGNHLWNIIDYELFNQVITNFIQKEVIFNDVRIKAID